MELELGQIFGIWIWELKLGPLNFKNQNQNQFKH
jgi:hypothetical protein